VDQVPAAPTVTVRVSRGWVARRSVIARLSREPGSPVPATGTVRPEGPTTARAGAARAGAARVTVGGQAASVSVPPGGGTACAWTTGPPDGAGRPHPTCAAPAAVVWPVATHPGRWANSAVVPMIEANSLTWPGVPILVYMPTLATRSGRDSRPASSPRSTSALRSRRVGSQVGPSVPPSMSTHQVTGRVTTPVAAASARCAPLKP